MSETHLKDQAGGANGKAAAGNTNPGKTTSGPHTTSPQPAAPASSPTVSSILGEITWLMSQSPTHKHHFIADLEWLVMPAVLLGQFRLYHGPDPFRPNNQRPIGCLLWALATPEVSARLSAGDKRMRPEDWRPPSVSGATMANAAEALRAADGTVHVVDVIAPFGGVAEMVAEFREKVFEGREVRWQGLLNL